MSRLGQTEVYGHGLVAEGRADAQGNRGCACGELAPAGSSGRGARRWHVQHKRTVLIGRADELTRVVEVAMLDLQRISRQLEVLRA